MSINAWEELVNRLQDREYRSLFVSEHIDTGLRFQIRSLRESKGSQAQVSKEWGKAQPWICKLESPNYGRYSLGTLKEIAEFYDVGLMVQFVPFSVLVGSTLRFPEDALKIPPFSRDAGLIQREQPSLRRQQNRVLPAMPPQEEAKQIQGDPSEDIKRQRDNLFVMEPKHGGGVFGIPIPPQTDLVQAQVTAAGGR